MNRLFLQAYRRLFSFEWHVARENFRPLYEAVRQHPIRKTPPICSSVDDICQAMDVACIWYWKQVLCLQRSAATTCLLKDFGISAQMVIGAQALPFKAHAWVEVERRVVNDKPYINQIYAVLERC
jgi:hypothetical protein